MLKEILALSLTGMYHGLRDSIIIFDCYIVVVITKRKGT